MSIPSARRQDDQPGHDVSNAWLSIFLLPVAFGFSFLIGEGLIGLLGYPVGGDSSAPLWAILLATIPALLVFCVPAVVSTWFAGRAAIHGDRRGWVPAFLLGIIAVAFIAMNILAGLGFEANIN